MGHELKGREIFAVGIWNDMDFSEADLDDIVANFNILGNRHRVPLKFGHNEDQEITDGQPAIGWVSRIFKQGEKLFADFSDMPRTVFEAIKNKLYRTVSIELLFNVDNDGTKFNHVLDAVALLGADHPAVNSLADLDALLATRTRFTGGHRVAFNTIAGKGTIKTTPSDNVTVTIIKEEFELDKKEVQELIDVATKPLADNNEQLTKDLKAANDTIAKFTSDAADTEKQQKAEKVKLARKEVTDLLDAAVRDKSLTPANRENYEKQIGVDDDDRVISIDLEQVKTMFNIKPENKQQGLHKPEGDNDVGDNPEEQLLALTKKNREAKETFQAAFMRTCEANETLHVAYLNANGEKK